MPWLCPEGQCPDTSVLAQDTKCSTCGAHAQYFPIEKAGYHSHGKSLAKRANAGSPKTTRDDSNQYPRPLKPLTEQEEKTLEWVQEKWRGWTIDVWNLLGTLEKEEFTIQDAYAFEGILQRLYPSNKFILDKIRQQLQILRDQGLLEFVRPGFYRIPNPRPGLVEALGEKADFLQDMSETRSLARSDETGLAVLTAEEDYAKLQFRPLVHRLVGSVDESSPRSTWDNNDTSKTQTKTGGLLARPVPSSLESIAVCLNGRCPDKRFYKPASNCVTCGGTTATRAELLPEEYDTLVEMKSKIRQDEDKVVKVNPTTRVSDSSEGEPHPLNVGRLIRRIFGRRVGDST